MNTCDGGRLAGPLALLAVKWVSLSADGSTDSKLPVVLTGSEIKLYQSYVC